MKSISENSIPYWCVVIKSETRLMLRRDLAFSKNKIYKITANISWKMYQRNFVLMKATIYKLRPLLFLVLRTWKWLYKSKRSNIKCFKLHLFFNCIYSPRFIAVGLLKYAMGVLGSSSVNASSSWALLTENEKKHIKNIYALFY